MPYIKQEGRVYLDNILSELQKSPPTSPGEINYLISNILVAYIKQEGLSYQTLNDIIGALECAKMEFNRRIVAPYENKKIKENGDL